MDENKQFDNDGAPITPPPVPPPAPRYRHEHTPDAHESCCTGKKEDDKEYAISLRVKRRHLKLAALLLAAFMLGSLWTQMKYYAKSYSGRLSTTNISDMMKNRATSYSSGSSYTIEIPQAVERKADSASPYSYSYPSTTEDDIKASYEYNYEHGSENGSHNNYGQRSYYFDVK